MKKTGKRIIGILLAFIMLFVLVVACNNEVPVTTPSDETTGTTDTTSSTGTGTTDETAPPEGREYVELTLVVNQQVDQITEAQWRTSPVLQAIREDLNVGITYEIMDTEKFGLWTASGDLPDLVFLSTTGFNAMHSDYVATGRLVRLDDPDYNLMELYAPDLLAQFPEEIAAIKRTCSNDTGYQYWFPAPPIGPYIPGQEGDTGIVLNWEAYKAIGAPEIDVRNGPEQLVEVIKQMVDYKPLTDDGMRVYGVSTQNSWGMEWIFCDAHMWLTSGPWDRRGMPGGEETFVSRYIDYEQSFLWQTAYFFFLANQAGIFDIDGFMQPSDIIEERYANEQIMYAPFSWFTWKLANEFPDDARGYMLVPYLGPTDLNTVNHNFPNPVSTWTNYRYGLTTNCDHPERAVEFMNYVSKHETVRKMYSGNQGEHWDIIDGVPQMLPHMFEFRANGGQAWEDWNMAYFPFNRAVVPTGHVQSNIDGAFLNLWAMPQALSQGLTSLQRDYSDFYNVTYPYEIVTNYIDSGRMWNSTGFSNPQIDSFLPAKTEEMNMIEARVRDMMLPILTECVLAKDLNEFIALKDKAIAELIAAGAQELFEYETWRFEEAKRLFAEANS